LSGRPIPGYHVGGLDEDASKELLLRYGVRAPQDSLRIAIEKTRGHPQALIWLAALVSSPSIYTVDMACSEKGIWNPEHGEISVQILNKVFSESLSELETSILKDLWAFEEPVPVDALFHFSEGYRDVARTYRVLNSLVFKAMIELFDDRNIMLDDLVRDYIVLQINDPIKQHRLVADWYLNLPRLPFEEWRFQEDAHTTLRAIYHLTLANRQSEAMDLIREGIGRKLSYFGMHTERIRLCEDLLASETHEIWSPDLFEKAWLMRWAGYSYAARGEYERGEMLLNRARTIFEDDASLKQNLGPDNLAVCLNSLGKIALWQGEYQKAITHHKRALRLSEDYELMPISAIITCTDLAEANIYGYYESKDKALLQAALDWSDRVLASPQAGIDSKVRACACRAEAFALLGLSVRSIQSSIEVLELNRENENLYSYVQTLRAIGICASSIDLELAIASLARGQKLCSEIRYGYGNQQISGILEEMLVDEEAKSKLFNEMLSRSVKTLDLLIFDHAKNLPNRLTGKSTSTQ
jgi:tetratricopeptide (TPR) repeat protein